MHIDLLLTGNELMTGDIVDSNSAMIAQRLTPLGWQIGRKLTVGDDLAVLVRSLQEMTRGTTVLLVNGGLGPTVDDLTALALAKACDVPLEEHPAALAHLEAWCAERHIALNAANRKQTLLPRGASLIPNPIGSAVGFAATLNGCLVMCTPGVPRELEAMLEQTIMPDLTARFPPKGTCLRRFSLFGMGESSLQQRIADQIPDWPPAIELGFRAGLPTLELKLACREAADRPLLDQVVERVRPIIADALIGEGQTSLAERTVELLAAGSLKLTCAESCTGGLIAAQITQVAGASAVFDAGLVTYSNAMKTALLGVSEADLARHGAVSEPIALQMAEGALRASGADLAIAVTGVAGPGGGTAEKPVGTVWIAWGSHGDLHAVRLHLPFERQMFQQYAASIALDLIRRRVQGISGEPTYLRTKR